MQLDYFLYTARFEPTPVVIMIISFLYIIGLVWFSLIKRKIEIPYKYDACIANNAECNYYHNQLEGKKQLK